MGTRALVLSGGAVVGGAWETGLVKGLEDGGVALAEADLIVGTSAGSVVGSLLACGRSPSEMYEEQLAPIDAGAMPPMNIDLKTLTELYGMWGPALESEAKRAEMGALALEAKTATEEEWLGRFEQAFAGLEWPERPLVLTAVDAETGAFRTWDRESGVPLARAVASSCTVPGLFPAVTIDGRRYLDGGMRSLTSADLASGYETVVVIAVLGSRAQDVEAKLGKRIDEEVAALRDEGSTVELITPDEASREAFGPNPMDITRRAAIAEAGARQGVAVAPRLREVWSAAAAA